MIVAIFLTSCGTTIRIDDKYAVSRESVEGKRIMAKQNQTAQRILKSYLEKGLEHHEQESIGNY